MVQNKWIGALNTDKVLQLWPEHLEIFKQHEVDLSEITMIDSVGCAFLVQWAVACLRTSRVLHIRHLPTQGQHLMMLYGVQNLFNLSD